MSIGEIFDRAVTVFVRNIVLILLIWLVVEVPIAIAGSLAFPAGPRIGDDGFSQFHYHRRLLQHGASTVPRIRSDIIFLGMEAAIRLLACTATLTVLAGVPSGAPLSVLNAYRRAFAVWLRQPVLFVTFIVLDVSLSLIVFGLTIGAAFAFFAPFAILRGSAGLIVLPVVFLFVVTFVASSLIGLVLNLSKRAISIGQLTGWRAFAQSSRRVFASRLLWRNIIVSSIATAMAIFDSYSIMFIGSALVRMTGSQMSYWIITRFE